MSIQIKTSEFQIKSMTLKEITDLLDVRHDNAMRVVEKMLEDQSFGASPKIEEMKSNGSGTFITYQLNKRQSMAVAAKLNTALLMRVIDRWQELESQQPPSLPNFSDEIEAAQAWIEAKKSERLAIARAMAAETALDAVKPQVEFAMSVRNLNGSCLVEELAKTIGYGRNRFFAMLRKDRYLMANNQPYQRYVDNGYFVLVENTPFVDRDGNSHPSFTTRITGKGQVALEKKFRKEPRNALVLLQGGAA